VGKSALVQELYRPITRRAGFFLSGKFDQLRRDVPYAVVIQALTDLTRQLLTESQEKLDAWRHELLVALGPNGQVLIDVIPELEHVLGPQPAAIEMPSSESRNRLQLVFSRFLQVFARAAHPLTLFLDDLQWVDRGSLELLESLLLGGEVSHLLVIGAYRDNEVAPGHPLLLSMDRLRHAGLPIEEIALGPLASEHLTEFVSDLTAASAEDCAPLAALIADKTNGNPFFVREFVKKLDRDGLLRVDGGRWVWDLDAIGALGIADNVVDLVTGRLEGLSAETRDMLQLAGSLGAKFDLATLSVVSGRSPRQTWEDLWPAVVEGFVVALSDSYKLLDVADDDLLDEIEVPLRFVHDRVQQAAVELRSVAERQRVDWSIGQSIAAHWPVDQSEERLFDIVGHLNAGRALATSQEDRDGLAALNLRAAERARGAAAFASAHEHALIGIELLGEDGDARRYDLALPLLNACVETAYQTADYAAMDRWFDRTVAASQDILDVAWVQEIKTEALNAQGRPLDALSHALDYLAALGIDLPREPGMDEVVAEMGVAGALFAASSIEELRSAPEIEDPAVRIAVGLICKIYSSSYVASPFVFALVTLRQFVLVARHGNCAQSALSYAVYGLLQAGLANDVSAGYTFGSLCNSMLGRSDIKRFEAQALHLFNCHTRMWKEHVSLCADGERHAYQVGMETGEFEFGSYGGHVATKYSLFHGHELAPLRDEAAQYTAAMRRYRQDLPLNSHLPWHQAIVNLCVPGEAPHLLAGDVLDAAQARASLEEVNDRMAISNALTAELLLSVVFEEFEHAVAVGGEGNGFLDAVLSQFNQPAHMFLDALARLETWHTASAEERPALRETAEASLAALQTWAAAAPVNYAQKAAVIEAQLLSIDGDPNAARARFDQAIELAQEHEFLLDEALAFEAAARDQVRHHRTLGARHYLSDAREAYARWGATSKVALMEGPQVELSPTASTQWGMATITNTTIQGGGGGSLDLAALLRASEAISSEVVPERLMRRLLSVVMENAGASRAVLVLIEEGVARVQADGTSDGAMEVLLEIPLERGGWERLPKSMYNMAVRSGEPVGADHAARSRRFGDDPYFAARETRSALCVPIRSQGRSRGAIYLENNKVSGAFTPERAELVTLLAGQMAISIDNARLYENLERRVAKRTEQLESRNSFIREVFGRYMSDEVVDTLLESKKALRLGGQRRVVTLMFTDLRGFTAMCENLSPERALRTLNNYFTVMTEIIQRHDGTINNIMGDGLLIMFGAPLWREDDADRAVVCALEMQLAMPGVNRANLAQQLPELKMGIGIHTGEVVVGNVGSKARAKYSVIGRHVNLASRVEAMTSGGEIYLSEASREAAKRELVVSMERTIRPKGIATPLKVFGVVGVQGRDDLSLPEQDDVREPLAERKAVDVRRVEGKELSDTVMVGELIALGPHSVEFHLDDPGPPGSELVLDTGAGAVYCRVASQGATVVAHVTGGDSASLR